MPLKDVLIHVDGGPANWRRPQLACDLARRHAAHLLAAL